MKRTLLSAVLLVSAICTTEVRAQLATNFRTIPPVSRPLYIMQYGTDSAAYAMFTRLIGDTIVYRGLIGRGTLAEMQLPLPTVSRIEMAELSDWRTNAEHSAIFGGLTGIALGGGGAAVSGKRVAAPAILGAVAGTVAGYVLGRRSSSGRVICWRAIYQRADADSVHLAGLRRVRSAEPACESIGRR